MSVHKALEKQAELRNSEGVVIATGTVGEMMVKLYYRAKLHGAEVWWGDHFRVMKRRKDPENLYMKCNKIREGVYIIGEAE